MIIRIRKVNSGFRVRVEQNGTSFTLPETWNSFLEARIAGCAYRDAYRRKVAVVAVVASLVAIIACNVKRLHTIAKLYVNVRSLIHNFLVMDGCAKIHILEKSCIRSTKF